MGRPAAAFLVLEPDLRAAGQMSTAIHEFGRAHVVNDVADAEAWLSATGAATGVVVNVAAMGPAGVEWLRSVRPLMPMTPLLCLIDDTVAVSELAVLRGEELRLPCSVRELRGFARRALAFGRVRAARLSWFVEYAGKRAALSASSTEVLVQAVAAAAPGRLVTDLGTTHNTLAAQIRNLVSARSEEALLGRADELLLRLLQEEGHPQADGLMLGTDNRDLPDAPVGLESSAEEPSAAPYVKRLIRH